MKRVGIISYHSGHNYGTMLQAYALQYAISKLGIQEAEYINYVDGKPFREASWTVRIQKIKDKLELGFFQLAYQCLFRKKLETIAEKYNCFFQDYINTSKTSYSSIQELKNNPPQYDVYIVGSDQTWNPTFLKDNGAYFLCFVDDSASKNSYASSLGVYSLTEEQKRIYKKYLYSFKFVSCREKVNASMLTSLLGKKVEHVLDPTLLLKEEDWMKIERKYDAPEKYILCYCLGEKKEVRAFAKQLGKAHNIPVFYIPSNYRDLLYGNTLFGVGPLEFLYLFRHATYICTDSFHGTIFSINFRKNFYSFYKRKGGRQSGDNSRIFQILNEFSLINRLKDDKFEEELDIDYKNIIDDYLEQEREHSFSFLKQILYDE